MASLDARPARPLRLSTPKRANARYNAGRIGNSVAEIEDAIERLIAVQNDLDNREQVERATSSYIGQALDAFRDGLDSLATARRLAKS